MKDKINAMSLEQLTARAAEIDGTELSTLSTDELTQLDEERQLIRVRLAELRLQAARNQEQRANVAGMDKPGRKAPEDKPAEKRTYDTASPEYRSGFLKTMLGRQSEMTQEERTAVDYVATTTDNTYGAGLLVNKTLMDKIWERVKETHSIVADIDMLNFPGIIDIPIHTQIVQGDATTVEENAQNDDEVNQFITITLNGQDISKHLWISYAMQKMSIDAFEPYLAKEIATRIGDKVATMIVTQILTDYDSTNNTMTSTAVKAVSYKDMAELFSMPTLGEGRFVVYGKRATIYKYLVGMVDTTGRPIFQPNAQTGAENVLIDAPVKEEDAVPANVLLVGYPQTVVGNMIQDVMIETDRDIVKHKICYSGYARFGCKLVQPTAFAKYTVKQS